MIHLKLNPWNSWNILWYKRVWKQSICCKFCGQIAFDLDCLNDSPGPTISFKLANIHVEGPKNTLQIVQRNCMIILLRQSKIPNFFLQKKILTYDATRSDVFWKVNLKCTRNFEWNAEKSLQTFRRNPFEIYEQLRNLLSLSW